MKLIKTRLGDYAWLYGPGEINQKFCGGILEAIRFGENDLEIPRTELIYGICDATKNNNDVVEFGDIQGSFIFSRKARIE